MINNKLYDEKSIESLSPLAFTRLRPGVYAGDTTYSTQLVIEIVSNAVDEFRLGHGDKIIVEIDNDNVTVQDFGQGFIPNSFREDGKSILEAAFSVLNTSGKYREDGTYEGTSLGSFGIGSKITTFLSNWLTVETHRDNQYERIDFVEGEFSKRTSGEWSEQTGTIVSWKASKEFFTHPEPEIGKLKSLFKTIVCLCPGLTIVLKDNGTTTNFFSKNGLDDLADDMVGDKEIIDNRLVMNYEEGKDKLDLVLTYTSNYSSTFVSYVNAGLVETSPIQTQIKATLTREMNKFFREKKWLKEKDENLSGEDIQEGIFIVFNATCPGVGYDSQVKTRVVKMDCKNHISAFTSALQDWLSSNEKEIKNIADKAISAKKTRDAAKKARDAARGKAEKNKKALKFDSKLADANSKDRSKCEIYITEGDSASGNLKLARIVEYQAVIPIRGKVLNCQKATAAQILKNAEIVTMMDAFFGHTGWGVDPNTSKIWYDMTKVRYGKIIIESDADVDGAHIKNLFYTFIWNICPELITQGYIYAGVPPLYKITEKNGKSYKYLKDDAALLAYRKENEGKKYIVGRMKGLGEMGLEETEECLTNPDNRIIRQVQVEDIKKANILFEQLMGTVVLPRKKFLKDYAEWSEYNVE